MNEFLKSLYTEGLLEFDFTPLPYQGNTQGGWEWDLEEIKARGFTDNVVEFMPDKIQKLSDNTQETLKIAACIGNQFELKTLASIREKSLG